MTGEKSYMPHISAAVLTIVSGLVYHFEGEKLHAYFDPPHVASICDGHTKDVKITDTATLDECAKLRADDIAEAYNGVHRLVRRPMTEGQEEAFTDFVFNEGEGTFSRSSVLRDFNAGRTKDACEDFNKYVCDTVEMGKGDSEGACALKDSYKKPLPQSKQNKHLLPGLATRRETEYQLCMKDVK